MGGCASRPDSPRGQRRSTACADGKAGRHTGNGLSTGTQQQQKQQQRPQQQQQQQRRASGGGAPPPGLATPPSARNCHSASSLGSTDSDSDADSDWDDLSCRQDSVGPGPASPAAGLLCSRETVGSMTAMGSVSSQLRLRQDSLFGLSGSPLLAPVRDSARLRLCKVGGCTFVNQYLVVKYLGRGSSGRVFLCMCLDDHRLYAVKIVKKDPQSSSQRMATAAAARAASPLSDAPGASPGPAGPSPTNGRRQRASRDPLADLRREVAVMRRALHPNVVALREVVDDCASNKMLLVMDYLEGGPVMTREGLERGHRIPEAVARLYFRDMAKALAYLHSQRVVHGDLKPENALMGAGGRVALSDFGCSKLMATEDGEFDRCNGTPAFLAPEMMKPHARYRGRAADVYALGACLYAFIFGSIPFKADTVMRLFEVVQCTPVTFPRDIPASEGLKALLLGMLEKDPAQRLTLPQVMAHPWMTAGDGLLPLAQPQPSSPQCAQQQQLGEQRPEEQQREERQAAQAAPRADGGAASVEGAPNGGPVVAATGGGAGGDWQQGPTEGDAAGVDAAALERLQQQEAEAEVQRDQLLRASLLGLVANDLPVHTFAAGEPLMLRGQHGAHMFYIIDGEVEVHYQPSAMQAADVAAATGSAAATPPSVGIAAMPSPAAGGGGGAQPPVPQQQQQQQQQQGLAAPRPSSAPSSTALVPSKRQSAAGLFRQGSVSEAAESAFSAGPPLRSDSLDSSCTQPMAPTVAGQLCARRNSTFLEEVAEAAADDLAADDGGSTAQLPPLQQPAVQQQQQQQQQKQQANVRGMPGLALQLATPGLTPGLSSNSHTPELTPRGGAAGTPAAATPAAAAPSPGPYGLRQQGALVDMEGAAAQLQSPSPAAAAALQAGRSAAWRWGSGGSAAEQGQQQQWQGAAQPSVEGEELPATLIETAACACELLSTLRRGPREFLVARRGPGDFVGEMEALSGSASRRHASVVAASSSVQAAAIPYAAAKAYLSRTPLAKQQLAQLMWLRQSENIVLEGLARLAALGEEVLPRLLEE